MKGLAISFLWLYLIIGVFADTLHNHPLGGQGGLARGCAACSWAQTSFVNLVSDRSFPRPQWVLTPLFFLRENPTSWPPREVLRQRSPPHSSSLSV